MANLSSELVVGTWALMSSLNSMAELKFTRYLTVSRSYQRISNMMQDYRKSKLPKWTECQRVIFEVHQDKGMRLKGSKKRYRLRTLILEKTSARNSTPCPASRPGTSWKLKISRWNQRRPRRVHVAQAPSPTSFLPRTQASRLPDCCRLVLLRRRWNPQPFNHTIKILTTWKPEKTAIVINIDDFDTWEDLIITK